MPRELSSFLHLHAGQTAWLFGKGPSLDAFDFTKAGPLRVAINDVVGRVPGCVYGFANDSVSDWAHVYQHGLVLFQPRRLEHDIHAARCPVACERVMFSDDWQDDRLAWPPERLAREGLAVRRGTLGSAQQILRVMGVRRIVAVGIDGGGRHASGQWHTRLRHDHAADYNGIRDAFITACHLSGMELEFHGADLSHQLPNGMKIIKIGPDAILVQGVHRCAGEVFECPPLIADELVAAGRATHFTPPPKDLAPAETTAAAPVAETATPAGAPARARRGAPKPAAS